MEENMMAIFLYSANIYNYKLHVNFMKTTRLGYEQENRALIIFHIELQQSLEVKLLYFKHFLVVKMTKGSKSFALEVI